MTLMDHISDPSAIANDPSPRTDFPFPAPEERR